MNARPSPSRPGPQRGVASLAIVAILFFVLSLVAAYTNRNLIFEQRTSANQYRSTQAFEAAEAGIEWALAMLNAGSITAACLPSDDPVDTTYRERYLQIAADTGLVTAVAPSGGGTGTIWSGCVFDGDDWNCSCPDAGSVDLDVPAGDGPFPAFRVRLSRASTVQPGLVLVESNGCTRLDDACLDFPATGLAGEGRATVQVLVAMRSALPAMPIAALTVREGLDVGGAALGAFNAETSTTGISILAGGAVAGWDTTLRLGSIGGTPGSLSVAQNDPVLGDVAFTADRLFESTFAARPATFQQQPGLHTMVECGGTCDAGTLRDAAALNRGRVLWVDGDVDFDDDSAPVGTADLPVMIVATGSITFSAPVTVNGLLYSRAATWASSGAGQVNGAAIAEGAFGGSATTTFSFDRAVLTRLQWRTGSFVRVPGGWADFREPAP